MSNNDNTINTYTFWLFKKIFTFIGLSGWLLLFIIVLENRVAMPIPGGNPTLDLLVLLTCVLWLLTRTEVYFCQYFLSPPKKDMTPEETAEKFRSGW